MVSMSFDEICRRAGGRRRYNCQRHAAAEWRRFEIHCYLYRYGYEPGLLAALARYYHVHRGTISRDVQRILKGRPMPLPPPSPAELAERAKAINDRRLRRR